MPKIELGVFLSTESTFTYEHNSKLFEKYFS